MPIANPMMQALDQTNQVSPIKLNVEDVKKTIFPPNFTEVNEFEPLKLRNSFDYENPTRNNEDQKKFANRSRIIPIAGSTNMLSQND